MLQRRWLRGVLYSQKGRKSEWMTWIVWNATLLASFLFWFIAVGRIQSGAEAEFMGEYWKVNFPPIHQPWNVPFWLLKTHASDFLAYPVGGPNWASSGTFIVWHRRALATCSNQANLHSRLTVGSSLSAPDRCIAPEIPLWRACQILAISRTDDLLPDRCRHSPND